MTGLQKILIQVCQELALDCSRNKVVMLDDGSSVEALVHILQLGARKGMLIFSNVDGFWPQRNAIRAAGYGYCVLEETALDAKANVDSFKSVFADWGWAGDHSSSRFGWKNHKHFNSASRTPGGSGNPTSQLSPPSQGRELL